MRQIEAEEAVERYDRGAMDCSPEFERHRRHQSARHRELMQTLEAFRKMRKEEFGMENGRSGMRNAEWGMGNEQKERRRTEGGWGMAHAEVTTAGCGDGENGEPTQEVCRGPIVGYDSNRVIDDSTNELKKKKKKKK